jgi:hypothetical protein
MQESNDLIIHSFWWFESELRNEIYTENPEMPINVMMIP